MFYSQWNFSHAVKWTVSGNDRICKPTVSCDLIINELEWGNSYDNIIQCLHETMLLSKWCKSKLCACVFGEFFNVKIPCKNSWVLKNL